MTPIANDILERASEALSDKNLSTGQVAGVALELSALITELSEHLEPLKERLRVEAKDVLLADGRSSGKISLDGVCSDTGAALGEVWVTFPQSKLALPPKADVALVREALGDADFEVYFESKLTWAPRRNLKEFMSTKVAMGGKQAATAERVLGHVVMKEGTPRVGFRPVDGILIAGPTDPQEQA